MNITFTIHGDDTLNNEYFMLLIASFPFFTLGIIFFTIGHLKYRKTLKWPYTEGEVINENEEIKSIGPLITIKVDDDYPTVRYKVDNVEYTYRSNVSQKPNLPKGKIVEVFYNPDNPEEAVINTLIQNGGLFRLIGIVLLCITVAIPVIYFVYVYYFITSVALI